MKKIFIILLLIIVNSCATVSQGTRAIRISGSDYIDITSFCKKHNFEYSFDTVDDLLKLYSEDKEINLLLFSSVGTFCGTLFYLEKPLVYAKGKIFIPRQLEKIITSKHLVSFRPLFTIKTIVVDPGHGGKDPGAISPRGLQEKGINLRIAQYLKEELKKLGFEVILTRTRDVFRTLAERTKVAKLHNADLFISIHANSNPSRKISGVELYYLAPSRLKALERSVKLAKSENFQGRNIPMDVKAILWDLLITKNYGFSVELSNIFYLTFKNLGFKVRSPKKASFHVLRFAYVPSVLVETGYLTNRYEEKALRKKHYQKQIAHAIALAVTSLKRRYNTPNSEDYVQSH